MLPEIRGTATARTFEPGARQVIRLYDRLVSGEYEARIMQSAAAAMNRAQWEAWGRHLRSAVANATPIVADNVYAFQREIEPDPPVNLTQLDMPNLVPPFESFWCEWREIDTYVIGAGFETNGVMCSGRRRDDGGFEIDMVCMLGSKRQRAVIVDGSLYTAVIRPDLTLAYVNATFAGDKSESWKVATPTGQQEGANPAIAPALLCVSFMNCRNVAVPWLEPDPGMSRAYERRHGKPLSRYRVIEITPSTKLRPMETGEKREDGSKARAVFREIRGHFKHYESGKGLFGKHKGTFFFPAHTAGSGFPKQIAKGYRIKT